MEHVKDIKVPHPVRCRICGELHIIQVVLQDFVDWHNGKLIQNAMPYLSVDERELLISNTCEKCWYKLFPPEKE